MRNNDLKFISGLIDDVGNCNPCFWVKDEFGKGKYSPSNIFVDDDGDIVFEIDSFLLRE